MAYLFVFLGGGIGAALRHGVNLTSARLLGTAFPYHTLFENAAGSFVMGVLAGYFAMRGGAPQNWQLFLTTGILGGFTTFSAFAVEGVRLVDAGAPGLALGYIAGSVVVGVLLVRASALLTRRLLGLSAGGVR